MLIFAGVGAAIASRQLWLQSLPEDQVPTCGPGFDYMVSNFPLSRALSMILSGSGECAEVQWRFLGLSIPGWSLVMFAGFMLLAIYLLFSKSARQA
jgi:disulfide bond formation protein DsbB